MAQPGARVRITQATDENRRVVLRRNRHPLARAEFDRGPAPADLPMARMILVLSHDRDQNAALDRLIDEQQDQTSPHFHEWLTPDEFGRRFGPADTDTARVTEWLESHLLRISGVSRGRGVIEFSGTARQVEDAFRTPIHKYVVNGEDHWANAGDPEIPAALAPVVEGVASLHDFHALPQLVVRPDRLWAQLHPGFPPDLSLSGGSHAMAPADFGVVYNIKPLYNSGITGAGTVIGVVARTNINPQDVIDFRSVFGLSNNPPQIVVNGTNPGNLGGGEETEAVLDASWASAIAPGATVKLVVSKSTAASDGVLLSEQYIVDNNLADIITESFGDCEAHYTSGAAAALASIRRQAAAQGIAFLVSSGDTGAAGCDSQSATSATGPVSANILATSPYNIAVGGTQFNEHGSSQYWSATNGVGFGSALSPIPENVWNQSCAAQTCGGGANIIAGGGGASSFFAKPAWQAGVPGIPPDGRRDIPDVSLTASAARDPYALCLRGSCQPNGQGLISFSLLGGTSASTPAFAGILALVQHHVNHRLGNANYVLYRLAAAQQYGQCDGSSIGTTPAASCVFNDITSGNNAVPGEPGYGTGSAQYQATFGYDPATGLGSVNAALLAQNWNSVGFTGTNTVLAINPSSLITGHTANLSVQVSPNAGSGVPSGDVALISSTGLSLGVYSLSTGLLNTSITDLPAGSYSVRAHYGGDAVFAASDSAAVPVVVTDPPAVSIVPANLTFDPQALGTTSAAKTIKLTNLGPGTLNIASIAVSGTNAVDFSQSNPCGTTVAAGSNCTISVTFTPAAIGARTASIQIVDNAAGSPHLVPLSGGGTGTGSSAFYLRGTSAEFTGLTNGSAVHPANAPAGLAGVVTVRGTGLMSLAPLANGDGVKFQSGGRQNANTAFLAFSGAPVSSLFDLGHGDISFSLKSSYSFAERLALGDYRYVFQVDDGAQRLFFFTISAHSNRVVLNYSTGSTTTFGYFVPIGQEDQKFGKGVETKVRITWDGSHTSLYLNDVNVTGVISYTRMVPAWSPAASFVIGATSLNYSGGGAYACDDALADFTIAASGAGSAPQASLAPSSLIYVSQNLGTISAAQSILFSNPGTAALSIGSIAITGANAADFLQTNNCGVSIAAGASCTISVTFKPIAAGNRTASVTITDNAAGSPHSATLAGTGTAVPQARLTPSSLTYAAQNLGTASTAQKVTLNNSGTAALTVNSIGISGVNAADFLQTNNCGASVAAGAGCTLSVTFKPTATGSRVASVVITDNAAGSPHTVTLNGTGAALPQASLTPPTLTYASQNIGTTSTVQTLNLSNPGTAALSVSSIAINGVNAADFSQTSNCGASVAPGGSCTISVTFKPIAAGGRTASVTITDNAAGSPHTAALNGTGAAAGSSAFYLRGTSAEFTGLTNGSAVHPANAPAGLAGVVTVRGTGLMSLAPLANGDGVKFQSGGRQNANTAFLAFSGAPVSSLFDLGHGDISFSLKSSYSFAERLALGDYRYVFQVDDGAQRLFFFTISAHSNRVVLNYSTGSTTTFGYFVPIGQEDQKFGKGVETKVRITWDGSHTSLYLNDVNVTGAISYTRMVPAWSPAASFVIGANSLNYFGGGAYACDDALADFTIK